MIQWISTAKTVGTEELMEAASRQESSWTIVIQEIKFGSSVTNFPAPIVHA